MVRLVVLFTDHPGGNSWKIWWHSGRIAIHWSQLENFRVTWNSDEHARIDGVDRAQHWSGSRCYLSHIVCHDGADGPGDYDRNHSHSANAAAGMFFTFDGESVAFSAAAEHSVLPKLQIQFLHT